VDPESIRLLDSYQIGCGLNFNCKSISRSFYCIGKRRYVQETINLLLWSDQIVRRQPVSLLVWHSACMRRASGSRSWTLGIQIILYVLWHAIRWHDMIWRSIHVCVSVCTYACMHACVYVCMSLYESIFDISWQQRRLMSAEILWTVLITLTL